MTKLRAAIIGLGVGETHIAGYRRHPECRVVSLCDFDEAKQAYLKDKYPECSVVGSADAVLADPEIDIVSIASYDNYHHEQVCKAISNGKHVFVEKPLCLSAAEAANIRALLREKPQIKLSSNLILRMSPRFRLLKQMISEGKLGQVYRVEGAYNYGRLHKLTDGWRGKIDFYSVVYGGAVHLVDLLMWLVQDKVTEVAAYGTNVATRESGFEYDDMVVAILRFRNGIVGKVATDFGCVFPHFHELAIYGTEATFVNGRKEAFLYESRGASSNPKRIRAAYPGSQKGDLIKSFIDSILDGKRPEVTTEEVFETMSVCLAIEKAARTREGVKVTYV